MISRQKHTPHIAEMLGGSQPKQDSFGLGKRRGLPT